MRRGFTLIEALIATALGAVICLTAWAAVRLASQAVVAARRLAIDNGILRAGIAAALDDLDTWTSIDDPGNPAAQTLRGAPNPWPKPFGALALPAGVPLDLGASDPRGWFRGDPTHHDWTAAGDYALLSGIAYAGDDAQDEADKRWYGQFMTGVTDGLGYYALIDAAPACMLYSYIRADGRTDPEFWVWNDPFRPGTFYNDNHTGSHGPRDYVDVTRGTDFRVTSDPDYVARGVHRRYFAWWCASSGKPDISAVDGWGRADMPKTDQRIAALPLGPDHWPALRVATRHLVQGYRFWDSGTVTAQDPLTGATLKLYVATTTTTLRGARRQRGLEVDP